jgi:hypothetical protein
MIISHSVPLRIRNVSDSFVKEIKTHASCSITLFPKIVPFMRKRAKILHSGAGHR